MIHDLAHRTHSSADPGPSARDSQGSGELESGYVALRWDASDPRPEHSAVAEVIAGPGDSGEPSQAAGEAAVLAGLAASAGHTQAAGAGIRWEAEHIVEGIRTGLEEEAVRKRRTAEAASDLGSS